MNKITQTVAVLRFLAFTPTDILTEAGCDVDIWRTTYYHIMDSHQAIIDWVARRACALVCRI